MIQYSIRFADQIMFWVNQLMNFSLVLFSSGK